MKVACFTSFTFSYLNRARVLLRTLRRHHPDWHLIAVITDEPPPGVALHIESEDFDEIAWLDDLEVEDARSWIFGHDVVEACTAVKGPFADQLCRSGRFDAIVYLDPDIAVFSPLTEIETLLKSNGGLLTPHLLKPEATAAAIEDNELSTLRTGIFNLGFLAIATHGEGPEFAAWWADRLVRYCHDDLSRGLFVDQKWCDHVPAFFETFGIIRHPGYNVASWNLSRRRISIDWSGQATVNGQPLRFWHFTKLGPVGDAMTRRYAQDNFEVYEIWNWYRRQIDIATDPRIPDGYWAYGRYDDGEPIPKAHRELYRSRPDLKEAFPDPFSVGPGSFKSWLATKDLNEDASYGC